MASAFSLQPTLSPLLAMLGHSTHIHGAEGVLVATSILLGSFHLSLGQRDVCLISMAQFLREDLVS